MGLMSYAGCEQRVDPGASCRERPTAMNNWALVVDGGVFYSTQTLGRGVTRLYVRIRVLTSLPDMRCPLLYYSNINDRMRRTATR